MRKGVRGREGKGRVGPSPLVLGGVRAAAVHEVVGRPLDDEPLGGLVEGHVARHGVHLLLLWHNNKACQAAWRVFVYLAYCFDA